jgi:XTP/dITP diphosphohydrolase
MNENLLPAFQRLYDVVHELREKCPWDREQTKESLRHLTIEETYELCDAILKDDWDELKVEAGDLLLHILFYGMLAEEENRFTTTDLINELTDKLIRRHPHVYGDMQAATSEEVSANWEAIKAHERKLLGDRYKEKKKTLLSGVPVSMPSLVKALRMQEKVRSVGFDWEHPEQVWGKVVEEMEEFHAEAELHRTQGGNEELMEKEFGDLLFSLVNYARFVGINPEDALAKTNEKFRNRFEYLETQATAQGKDLRKMSLAEMDVYWEESKQFFR